MTTKKTQFEFMRLLDFLTLLGLLTLIILFTNSVLNLAISFNNAIYPDIIADLNFPSK